MNVVQEDERFHWRKTSKGIHYEKICYIYFYDVWIDGRNVSFDGN